MRVGQFPDLDGFFRGAAWKERQSTAKHDWTARVLATVDNHVIWKFPRATVQATHYRAFLDRFERAWAFDKNIR